MGDDWERFNLRADEFLPIGTDRVLVMGHVLARGRASGVEVDYAAAWLCYLRAGKVVRVRFYSDRDEALAAAGSRRGACSARCGRERHGYREETNHTEGRAPGNATRDAAKRATSRPLSTCLSRGGDCAQERRGA